MLVGLLPGKKHQFVSLRHKSVIQVNDLWCILYPMLKVRTPSNNMENVTAIKSGNIKGVKSCAVLTLLPLIMTCMLFVDIFSIDLTHFYQLFEDSKSRIHNFKCISLTSLFFSQQSQKTWFAKYLIQMQLTVSSIFLGFSLMKRNLFLLCQLIHCENMWGTTFLTLYSAGSHM